MKKIALIGYFGWGNFGDELFLKVHQQYLGKYFELVVANDLLGAPYFSRPVKQIVSEVDGILIGGGDLLNPLRVSELYWQMDFLEKPVFIFGLGVPNQPFRRENVIQHYKNFFQHPNCKLVVARDKESFDWIRNNICGEDKVCWYPDPVCSLNKPLAQPPKEKTLGVVMREHRSLDQDMSHVRKLIDEAKKMDYKIKHIVLSNMSLGKGDLERAKLIAQPDEEIFYSDSLDDMCIAISSCSMLASIKFHGVVVATMYGIPSIAMSVTPKNRNFLRMVERTEMLCSYTNENLYKHLSYFPTVIPNRTRSWLYRESKKGYERLLLEIRNSLGVD